MTHPIRIDRLRARLAARPFPSCRVPRRFLSVTSRTKTDREDDQPSKVQDRERKGKERLAISSVEREKEEKKERKGRPPAWSAHSVAAINPISQAGVLISALACPSRVQLDFRSILWTRCLGTKAKNRDQSCLWSRESVSEPGPFSRRRKRRRARTASWQKGSKKVEKKADRGIAREREEGWRTRWTRRRMRTKGARGGKERKIPAEQGRTGMSWKYRRRDRKRARGGTVRPWTRRLDAGFFQQGHGRMDVGIMEASTVPSLPDKNCRWKEDVDEGDGGRISRGEGERRAATRVEREGWIETEVHWREWDGERKHRRLRSLRWKGSTRDEEFRYALSSTVGRIKISSGRWRRYAVLEPLPFCARETRTPTERGHDTARLPNSPTETRSSVGQFASVNLTREY